MNRTFKATILGACLGLTGISLALTPVGPALADTITSIGDQEPRVEVVPARPAESFTETFIKQLSVTDGAPTDLAEDEVGITSRQRGANPEGARLARSSPNGGDVFVLPSANGICIASNSGVEEGCYEKTEVSASSVICAPGLPGDQVEVFGVAPNGISRLTVALADGTEQPIDVKGNVFIYRASKDAARPLEIAWTDAAGERQSVPAHVPADFREDRCATPADFQP